MRKLTRLTHKLAQRKKSLAKHSVEYRRHHLKGRKLRAKWHQARIESDKKAIKKLIKLIAKEKERQKHIIDWNGLPHLTYPPILKCLKVALSVPGLFLTATTNGVHSPGSWHYQARAFDGGSSGSRGESPECEAQQTLLDTFGAESFMELFGPLGWYVKNGVKYSGTFPGHGDHLHVAPY